MEPWAEDHEVEVLCSWGEKRRESEVGDVGAEECDGEEQKLH